MVYSFHTVFHTIRAKLGSLTKMVQNAAEGKVEIRSVNAEHGCSHTEFLIVSNSKTNSSGLFNFLDYNTLQH